MMAAAAVMHTDRWVYEPYSAGWGEQPLFLESVQSTVSNPPCARAGIKIPRFSREVVIRGYNVLCSLTRSGTCQLDLLDLPPGIALCREFRSDFYTPSEWILEAILNIG